MDWWGTLISVCKDCDARAGESLRAVSDGTSLIVQWMIRRCGRSFVVLEDVLTPHSRCRKRGYCGFFAKCGETVLVHLRSWRTDSGWTRRRRLTSTSRARSQDDSSHKRRRDVQQASDGRTRFFHTSRTREGGRNSAQCQHLSVEEGAGVLDPISFGQMWADSWAQDLLSRIRVQRKTATAHRGRERSADTCDTRSTTVEPQFFFIIPLSHNIEKRCLLQHQTLV